MHDPGYDFDDESDDATEDDFPTDDESAPPLPMVVAWERLDASEFETEIGLLDEWVHWLIGTYFIDPQTIPHCWYLHVDLREELSHLHTGWLMTRHPQAGVGAIALEWDRHREATLARCRAATSATGCTATQGHRARPARQWPAADRDQFAANLVQERGSRDSAGITAAARAAVEFTLLNAERRAPIAEQALTAVADNPATPTPDELTEVKAIVRDSAARAVRRAEKAAGAVALARRDAAAAAATEDTLAAARRELAAGEALPGTRNLQHSKRWIAAVEAAAPTAATVRVAVRAAAGRVAATASAAAVLRRHASAAALVADTDDPDDDAGGGDNGS